MIVLAFLGNPGRKYARTRHNIGFIVGEALAAEEGISLKQKQFKGITGTGKIAGREVLFLFPQTYMNNSGEAVQAACRYYRIEPGQIITCHDEIEYAFGRVEMKFGGGHRGHNGIRSIIQHTGSPDFHRLRFGVGRPEHPDLSVADYVLGKFFPEEEKKIEELFPSIFSLITETIKSIE